MDIFREIFGQIHLGQQSSRKMHVQLQASPQHSSLESNIARLVRQGCSLEEACEIEQQLARMLHERYGFTEQYVEKLVHGDFSSFNVEKFRKKHPPSDKCLERMETIVFGKKL